MSDSIAIRQRLQECPLGYLDACLEVLRYLYLRTLKAPLLKTIAHSGTDQHIAVFAPRRIEVGDNWWWLMNRINCHMLLFDFRDAGEVGSTEVMQTRECMREEFGSLAVLCSTRLANDDAQMTRDRIYRDDKKLILLISSMHLREMMDIKERGEEPSDFFVDAVQKYFMYRP